MAEPIMSDYKKFIEEHKKKEERLKKELAESLKEKEKEVSDRLFEINKEYIEAIKECMVDVEDWQYDFKDLDILKQNVCCRFSYIFTIKDYPNFKNIEAKLDDVLGSDSYSVRYDVRNNLYSTQLFCSGTFLGRYTTAQPLSKLEEYIEGKPGDVKINAVFLFSAIV